MSSQNVVNKISLALADMTDQQQLQWLNLWANQSYAWMNKARQITERKIIEGFID